jgi:modulator of FtsH protease HflC
VRRNILIGIGAVLGALVLIAASALFTVHQTQQALVLQFGNPKRIITEPGLHVKLPFIQNAIYIDRRVLDYDAVSEEVILGDQKRLVVDAFARYRITDPLKFYQTVGSEAVLRGRINTILDASLRKVLGEVPLFTVLSEDRASLMNKIRDQANVEAKQFGIDVIDVRLKRADLPAENSQAIYRRMQTEREREAKELRAQGAEMAQRIRARADRERVVLLAEARKEAQITRGEGDATAVKVFADAFGQDVDFFSFYRSMQAYRNALADDNTSFVLSPDSEFFRYFGSSSPGQAPTTGAPGPAGTVRDQTVSESDKAAAAESAEGQAAADDRPAPAGAVVR